MEQLALDLAELVRAVVRDELGVETDERTRA